VPRALKRLVQERFGEYQLPRASDNLEEDIEYSKQHGGDGCVGVASADFNGDRQGDGSLLLASKHDGQSLLVVALRTKKGCDLERLRTWKSARNRLYVAEASPGKYQRSESFDHPPSEPGELDLLESSLSGLVTGRTEASGIYYFWTDHGWVRAWAID
jgi:hypothetical protein